MHQSPATVRAAGRETQARPKDTTAPATRPQFEAALARQKKTIMLLSPTNTLRRLTKSMIHEYGDPKEKVKYHVLRLKRANNTTKALTSKPSGFEEETNGLYYVGKVPAIQKYVLHATYYEGDFYLLVDRRTGKEDELPGEPIGSPTLQKLAAFSQGYPCEEAPNGLKIYWVAGGQFKVALSIATEKWLPYDLAWVNDEEFSVKTLALGEVKKAGKPSRELTPAGFRKPKFTYLRVTIAK